MIVGQAFGPDLFLITSNTGILLYMISMTRVLYEVRHDIRQAGDLGNFLIALESARSVPEKHHRENATEVSHSANVTQSEDEILGQSSPRSVKGKVQIDQQEVV